MKSKKILFFLIAIIYLHTTKSFDSDLICFGNNVLEPRSSVGDSDLNFLVNIFIKCNNIGHFVGTIISARKILTSAAPLIGIEIDQIIVSLDKTSTCPQLPPRGEGLKIIDVKFHPDLFPTEDKHCNDLAVIFLENDITNLGGSIVPINWDIHSHCYEFKGSDAYTYKCPIDSDADGFERERVSIQDGTDGPCPLLEVDVGSECSSLGTPLFRNSYLVGIETSCRPQCANYSTYSCLILYKDFLKPIIEGPDFDFSVNGRNHQQASEVFKECEYEETDPEVVNVRNLINNAIICSPVKEGLLQLLNSHIFNFKRNTFKLGIPHLLINEQCPCK